MPQQPVWLFETPAIDSLGGPRVCAHSGLPQYVQEADIRHSWRVALSNLRPEPAARTVRLNCDPENIEPVDTFGARSSCQTQWGSQSGSRWCCSVGRVGVRTVQCRQQVNRTWVFVAGAAWYLKHLQCGALGNHEVLSGRGVEAAANAMLHASGWHRSL